MTLTFAGSLVLSALTGCVAERGPRDADSPTSSPSASGSQGTATNTSPLDATQASNKAPVYWIGRSEGDVFLYREFRDVPELENPVTRALRAMMSEKPLDPDFFTPWQNPKRLATSISGKDVITVDVSEDAFNSNLDEAMAACAIQQLVYTATAAAASSGLVDSGQHLRVRILVDGHTDYVAFKHVQLGSLMARSVGLVAPVWIIDPQEGVEVTNGSIKISGRSTFPGGRLRWQILKTGESGIREPFLTGETTAASAPESAGTFHLSVNLPVGEYELRVAQLSADGDADRTQDTRKLKVQ